MAKRQIAGAAIGQFCSNSTLIFFLTWFPTYLATARHMALRTVGRSAVLSGGWLTDWLIRRTGSVTLGRKLPVIAGLSMAATIVAANFVRGDVHRLLIDD